EKNSKESSLKQKFRKLGLYSKQNFKSETKKSVKSITLNEDKHRFYDSSALLLNFISCGI
ncbi:hypothetical protein Avbf_03812, partial [Armadillidium vulgare]